MDPRALHYFQIVAELGSLSRAAQALRISQPAVSRQLRRLEDSLGQQLFRRNGHGVALTEPGRLLLDHAQIIRRQLDSAKAEIRGFQSEPTGTFTLGVPSGAGRYLLPPLAKRVQKVYPRVFLRIASGYSGLIQEWLVKGRVDAACLHSPIPQRGFEIVPLMEEEAVLVGKPGAFPFKRTFARVGDLGQLPMLLPGRPNGARRLIDELLTVGGTTPNIAMEVNDGLIIRAMLRAGLGFSLMSRGSVQEDVKRGWLETVPLRPRIYWPLALMLPASDGRNTLVQAIAGMIRQIIREQVAAGVWPGRQLDRCSLSRD